MNIKFNWEEKQNCLKCELGEIEMYVNKLQSEYRFAIYITDMLLRYESGFASENVAAIQCELEVKQIIESIVLTVKHIEDEH